MAKRTKTLGQVAREAFFDSEEYGGFEYLAEDNKRAWERAVDVVVEGSNRTRISKGC